MLIQSKIQNWKLRVRNRDCVIVIEKENTDIKKEIRVRLYKKHGMRIFPRELYNLIKKDITAANIYDKFLSKFWTWDEQDEC